MEGTEAPKNSSVEVPAPPVNPEDAAAEVARPEVPLDVVQPNADAARAAIDATTPGASEVAASAEAPAPTPATPEPARMSGEQGASRPVKLGIIGLFAGLAANIGSHFIRHDNPSPHKPGGEQDPSGLVGRALEAPPGMPPVVTMDGSEASEGAAIQDQQK